MAKIIRNIFLLVLLLAGSSNSALLAQRITSASGIVKDSITGEPMSYVSVIFENSTIGTMTDDNGLFTLQNDRGLTKLLVSSLGYENKHLKVSEGKKNEALSILIRPTTIQISEVVIKPTKEKYTKKDNPAVELIRNVIERKNNNRIEAKSTYQSERYEKLSIALDNFNPNLDKNKFLKKFSFIKNYLDTSEFNGKPILTVSVRETLSDIYYRKDPKSEKIYTKGQKLQGIDKSLDEGGITSNLQEIFQGINIFDNNINILLNRFVSPLSSTLATSYYKYYIMDTVMVGNKECIDLAFVPFNSQSYGFTGRLFITTDGHFAIKKFLLNVPSNINLNFVDNLRITQEFKQMPDSTWVLDQENTFINFYVIKGAQQLYAHQMRSYNNYNFSTPSDSVFDVLGSNIVLESAINQPDSFWVANRHVPLKEKENAIDILENRLIERSGQNRLKRVENILGQYHLDAGFDETRRLVHSLIKRITIKHEPNKRSGNFLVQIEYRGFDEQSIFMTNWQALNWYCLSYYRSRAITKEDLKEDKELARYLLKSAGKSTKLPKDFVGYAAGGGSNYVDIIKLNPTELIYFD